MKQTFSLADPRNGKVFYVGESEKLFATVGALLLRPPTVIRPVLDALNKEDRLPLIRTHEWETKEELLVKHVRTLRSRGRSGPESNEIAIAAYDYYCRLRARVYRLGASKEYVVKKERELSWRSLAKARSDKLKKEGKK